MKDDPEFGPLLQNHRDLLEGVFRMFEEKRREELAENGKAI